jgi:hypothetical protein
LQPPKPPRFFIFKGLKDKGNSTGKTLGAAQTRQGDDRPGPAIVRAIIPRISVLLSGCDSHLFLQLSHPPNVPHPYPGSKDPVRQ